MLFRVNDNLQVSTKVMNVSIYYGYVSSAAHIFQPILDRFRNRLVIRVVHDLSTIQACEYNHLHPGCAFQKLERPIKAATLKSNRFYQLTSNFTF